MKPFILFLFLGIALPAFSQPVFAITTGGDLYSLDVGSCTSRIVGSTGLAFADIAFTPDGVLWGIAESYLYRIDTTTASITLIGNTGIVAFSLVGLSDSIVAVESGSLLLGIHTANANSFPIDTIGYVAYGDISWYDHDLYMTTADQLIKIVLDDTHTDILNVSAVNEVSLPIITCGGVGTIAIEGNYNSIIGFSETAAYSLCQIDGTYQLLCDAIVPNIIAGSASMRLPNQVPEPLTCAIQTELSNIPSAKAKIEIFPNPVGANGTVFMLISEHILSPLTIRIITLDGLILFSKTELTSNTKIEIDLNSLALSRGIVVVDVVSAAQHFHGMLLIE